ncbi:MAG: cell division-associated BIMB-like, partial [Trebouxia sp. A1-2]
MTRQTRQEAGGVTPKMLLDSVASILEANAARQALDDVREYLDPVLRAARLQQKNPTASSQRLAKSHSTFVVNLLRVSLAKIASEQAPALQTAYIELASLGLEGLSVLRSSLKGRPHEVEAANQALSLKQQDFVEDGIEICKCAVQACLQSSSHLRLPQVWQETLHGGDRWLSILSVPATALLLKPSGGDGSNAHAWAENLLKANATIKELLQQLQSRRSGKKPARSATAATDKAEAGSSEIANLCQLAHAVLLAISSLRKTVQASAMQAPYSGCKADENQAAEEEPRDSLCTCLMLAAPLASVVVSLQSQLLPAEDPPQCNAADRLSYPALSGLVTACQIKSAVAIQDSARTVEVCSADAFEPFWSPAAWGQHQVPPLPLKAAEERWASSALFSCAVQLHSSNSPQSAETLFAAACDAAASSLCKVMLDGSQAAQPETQAQIQSFVRKNQALANALHQQGRIPAALNVLGNALKLLASLGMAFIKCGQPLVLALVTLRAGLHSGPVLKVASKPSSRGHRQRKVMHNMQADAAGALPADAPVAAYLDQLPQPVSSVALGEALAMEAKAVHEVLLEGLLPHSSAVKQGRSLLKQLGKVWSAQEQPVLHARALLLQARLSGLLTAPETAQDLTQQAIDLLADQQDDGTADVLATAHAMRALLHAQQLRQAGAERETSQPFTSSGQREVNLQTMASQLLKQEAKDLHSDAVLHSLRTTPGSPLVSWSLAPQPVAAVLPDFGSSAENDQSSAADLQQMAHELAASKQGRSAVVVWNRALLHQLAGQAYYQDGQMTSALYNASEALRLGSTLFSSLSPDRAAAVTDLAQPSALPSSSSHQTRPSGAPPQPSRRSPHAPDAVQDSIPDPDTTQAENTTLAVEAGPTEVAVVHGGLRGEVGVDGVGYWQVTWLYLTSLLKLGEAYEVAGSHEDALHAFREGQELGNNAAAADLTQAAMSDISSGSPCPKRKKGSRNCRESRPSSSSPPVTRRHHSFEHARALHMQAKIRAACSSPMASDCITLAGCDASLAQRQHSNAEASTSAPERLQGTGRSSRAAKSARGGRGTTTGSSTRAKAATAHVKDEYCHAKQCAEESDEEDLLQQAQLLLQAYQLSQGAPLLAREVARDLSKCCSKLGLVHAAVLLEHASLGASASAAITRAVAALEAGLSCNTPSQSDAGVTHAKEALQAIEDQASADLSTLASHLPPNVTITSLSIACTTSTNTSSASSQASRWHLTITRYQGADPPILMVIPVPSHSFLNPSDRGAEDEAPMALNHQARAAALEEFDSIMTDSASSMKSDAPLVTSANKTAWWRKRLELDQRMAALLQHLDEEWLGPWKVLLYGTPSDSTLALTLQEAADGFLSELSKQIHGQSTRKGTKQAQPTLKALMTALMWGAASLTARQLQVAARELLRLAGISSDDEAVDQLSQQIRSRYNDACGSSMSQAGSTADHSKLASTALRETTNVAPVAKRGSSRVTVKAMAPATEVAKPKAKGKTVNRALQTTGKQASRPSRFATMQSAATAAPAHRSPPVTDLTTPTSAAPSGHPQDPALVSQLQARFDALALEEEQGQEKPVQSRPNNGDDGGWVGRVLDHQSSLLVLDGELQTMPWESLPSLKQLRIYRAPSLACAAAVAARQPSAAEDSSADAAREVTAVNMASTVYMVNPAGDLSTTQATFEETFRQQHTWQGTAGEPMAPGPLAAALQGHDMFLYFGHGSGDQYLSARALRRMPRCASALLMGCSSGSLAKAGQYEPSGPVLAYLMAGCPVAIANLWDVTDRDIDRFSKEVLSKWIELVPEEGSSGQHDM